MWGGAWFILFVSVLTVLHYMFPNDGKLVFSLFIILFRFSKFTFCSCNSVCFVLMLVHYLLYGFSIFRSWRFILLSCFCLLIDASGTVLRFWSLFIFWCNSSISRSENQSFFIILLNWSASLVVWKVAHSCQISIILFLYPLREGLLLK